MTDLAGFIAARLDEDDRDRCEIHARTCESLPTHGRIEFPCDCGYPARVLREVEAKRAHIRMWETFAVNFTHIDETEFEFAKREALEEVLTTDAAVYSDHPDYPQD
jgi:hypothetical protein